MLLGLGNASVNSFVLDHSVEADSGLGVFD